MNPLARPIFIVAPPQSASSFLQQELGRVAGVQALNRRGREVFDSADELRPATRGHDSNRRTAEDATEETRERFRAALTEALRGDRDGEGTPARFVDATPRNALRVPFLDAIFPDAMFVYLYRAPRDTVAGMVEAWRSGEFVTYPQLPDWSGPPWSLLLVPGWRELAGETVPEIATEQWIRTTRLLLEDLERIPPERWSVADYEALRLDAQRELTRLCEFLELEWDPELAPGDPVEHVAITPPQRAARREDRLQAALPRTIGLAERARDLIARPVSERPTATPDSGSPLRSVHTASFASLLGGLDSSLLLSAPGVGKVLGVRTEGALLNTHFRDLESPRGLAGGAREFALATATEIWRYRDSAAGFATLDEARPYDACLVPRSRHLTGAIGASELAYAGEELWLVATRFSCLGTLDDEHSFVPRWRPRFVSELADEDRCHLSGLAVAEGRPAFVTALGATDEPEGWRAGRARRGVVVEVESGEIVAAGLSLPHTPRWHRGTLYLLESGAGTLCAIDPASGEKTVVAELPGFARGLALAGSLAFVGVSRLRAEGRALDLPVAAREPQGSCGIWIVSLGRGEVLGSLRFTADVSEIASVALLSGTRFPEIADIWSDTASTVSMPASS